MCISASKNKKMFKSFKHFCKMMDKIKFSPFIIKLKGFLEKSINLRILLFPWNSRKSTKHRGNISERVKHNLNFLDHWFLTQICIIDYLCSTYDQSGKSPSIPSTYSVPSPSMFYQKLRIFAYECNFVELTSINRNQSHQFPCAELHCSNGW